MTKTVPADVQADPRDDVEACAAVMPGIVRCDAALSHVFEILGKRWNGVILGALGYGPASFSQLARGVTGISDSVLSDRLSGLATAGLVTRVVDSGPARLGHLCAHGRGSGPGPGAGRAQALGARPPAARLSARRRARAACGAHETG